MPVLSLILVTHDSRRWLRGFAESWEALLNASPLLVAAGCEVVVADAGSADDSLQLIEEILPNAMRISCGNVGFGKAVNTAARAASGTWLLLCNPDLTFPAGFATLLLEPLLFVGADKPAWTNAACIAPRLINLNGTVQPSVGRFPTATGIIRDQFRPRENRKYHFPQPQVPTCIDWAMGACLLLQHEAFLAIDRFDEKYFLYMEEVDLQRRLKAGGYETWFVPVENAAVIHHHPNAARTPRPEVLRWSARGTLRYFAKFSPSSLFAYRWLAFLTGRLSAGEAFASRESILNKPTGP